MKKKRYISKILIAAFFLASYSGVYATYFLCNIVPLVSASTSHDHGGHDNNNHQKTVGHNHNTHNGDDHADEHGASMDGCCNDLTVPFVTSLAKLSQKQFHLEFAVGHVPAVHSYLVPGKTPPEIYPKLVKYIHPPPKVPDIRIFIQSFII